MIAQLTGTPTITESGAVIIDVNGVGYLVNIPTNALHLLPAEVTVVLHTHLVVREDDMTLYGFLEAGQRSLFQQLIGATGVGPKVGLALISTLDSHELARALSTNDTKLLSTTPGVGPKLAQRLCLELGDKMAVFLFEKKADRTEATKKTSTENAAKEDAIEGLVGLGYSRAEAKRSVEQSLQTVGVSTSAESLIAVALRVLNSR